MHLELKPTGQAARLFVREQLRSPMTLVLLLVLPVVFVTAAAAVLGPFAKALGGSASGHAATALGAGWAAALLGRRARLLSDRVVARGRPATRARRPRSCAHGSRSPRQRVLVGAGRQRDRAPRAVGPPGDDPSGAHGARDFGVRVDLSRDRHRRRRGSSRSARGFARRCVHLHPRRVLRARHDEARARSERGAHRAAKPPNCCSPPVPGQSSSTSDWVAAAIGTAVAIAVALSVFWLAARRKG